MIVTLTVHPSLDRTVRLAAALRVGEVQVATDAREDAGGKGINVTRVLTAGGAESVAVLPLAPGDPFEALLRDAGVRHIAVPVTGRTRANIAITDERGETTKVNLPGVALTSRDADAVIAAVVEASRAATWLVLAGSLAPGLPDDFYVRVIEAVRRLPAAPRIAVDTSGPALQAVVERGRPDVIKPNDDELVELTGRPLRTDLPLSEAVRDTARALVPTKAAGALITLGGAGAVLVRGDGAWAATPPPTRVRSTVGAGDSSLAGYLLTESAGASPVDALISAIRHGSAAAALDGTQAPTPHDLPVGDVPVRALHA